MTTEQSSLSYAFVSTEIMASDRAGLEKTATQNAVLNKSNVTDERSFDHMSTTLANTTTTTVGI